MVVRPSGAEPGGVSADGSGRLAAERYRAPLAAELDDSSTASFREVSRLLAQQLLGLDRRRFRHRCDLRP
jgi:hypothetical protein